VVESDGASGSGPQPESVSPGDSLDKVPPALRDAFSDPGVLPELRSLIIAAFSTSYVGPLPPADQMRAYEEVLPGSSARLLSMAERQQEHRHDLERVTVREAASRSRWGLRLGFVLALLVIGLAAAAIFTGHALTGFGLVIGEAAVLSGVFVYGRIDQRKERVEKDALTRTPPSQQTGPALPRRPESSADS
jgi:uncharacterized membrane protein